MALRRPEGLDLCTIGRLAAEADSEGRRLDREAIAAERAGDTITGHRLSLAVTEATARACALDDLATHYPATCLAGSIYATALAVAVADDLDNGGLSRAEMRVRAQTIRRVLLPLIPVLRDAAGELAANMDVSRLLPGGCPGGAATKGAVA